MLNSFSQSVGLTVQSADAYLLAMLPMLNFQIERKLTSHPSSPMCVLNLHNSHVNTNLNVNGMNTILNAFHCSFHLLFINKINYFYCTTYTWLQRVGRKLRKETLLEKHHTKLTVHQ